MLAPTPVHFKHHYESGIFELINKMRITKEVHMNSLIFEVKQNEDGWWYAAHFVRGKVGGVYARKELAEDAAKRLNETHIQPNITQFSNPFIGCHSDILDKEIGTLEKVMDIFNQCENDALAQLRKLENSASQIADLEAQMQDMREDVVNFYVAQIEEAIGMKERIGT